MKKLLLCLSSVFSLSLSLTSFLSHFSFFVFVIFPFPTPSLPSYPSVPLFVWASCHYQGVFSSILRFLSLSPSSRSISLSPLSSHFHADCWAATLCIFISVCGRRGGLVPATNGLLENTDSHASQSGELGREGGRIWSEAEGRVVSERWRKDIQKTEW